MFSRRPDRPKEEPRYAPPSSTTRPSDLVAVPVQNPTPQSWASSPTPAAPDTWAQDPVAGGEATVIAERDHLEGSLRSSQGVMVLGSFSGTIESETWIRMAEGSTVKADVTAEEVVVAGQYEGKLVAKGRLEIAATGHIRGDIEAPRLMLHEGGFIDGALYMTRTEANRQAADGDRPAAGKAGSVREAGSDAAPRKGGTPVSGTSAGAPGSATPAGSGTEVARSAAGSASAKPAGETTETTAGATTRA
jgi:cytoskeletal protein CcmA (bactofilin family)